MGKDSLIKSTAAKSGTKKKKSATKKATSKTSASAKSKKSAGSPAKTAKAETAVPSKPAAKLSVKDLLFKQFASRMPPAAKSQASPDMSRMTAPPFIDTEDPAEAARLRALLSRRYSMADVKAAAKPPAEIEVKQPIAAEPEPAPEPQATVEPEPAAEPQATVEPEPEPAPEPQAPVAPAPQPAPQAIPAAGALDSPEPRASQPRPTAADLPPQTDGPSEDPVVRSMKFGIAALGVLVVLILWASFTNSNKYYVVGERDGVTVLRGAFSPTGKRTLAVLPGLQLDAPMADVNSRKDVYPLVFDYYLTKADTMMAAGGLPDFPAVRNQLETAQEFALNREMRAAIHSRLNNLERTQLIHLAHVEISKDTDAALTRALQTLKQAQRLAIDAVQLEAINQIITMVDDRKAELQPVNTDAAPVEVSTEP